MTKVIPDGAEFDAFGDSVSGMRVPHPVRRGLTEFLGERRMIVFNNLRRLPEKPAHDFPQPQRLNAGIAVVQATDQRRDWVLARPAYRQAPLLQIPVQRRASERCQGHPGWLAAFSGDVKPVITCGVDLDVSQSRIGQFADPQSRGVTEIQHETKSLRCGCQPAV